jgi:ribosomal protein S18
MICNMMSKDKKTKGQKAESKRMTAMGLSEARARLKEIDKQKAANPGIGFKIPKKQEAQLRKFVSEYGKTKPKAGSRTKKMQKKK